MNATIDTNQTSIEENIMRKYLLLLIGFSIFISCDKEEPIDLMPYKKDITLIKKVIRNLPGRHTCLKESIIVHLFFKPRGINIPLFLGVITKDEFVAHAWYDINNSTGYNQL